MYATQVVARKDHSGTLPEHSPRAPDYPPPDHSSGSAPKDRAGYLSDPNCSPDELADRRNLLALVDSAIQRRFDELDLSKFSKQALRDLPHDLAKALTVWHITLPELRGYPSWLACVPGLKKLTLSHRETGVFDARQFADLEKLTGIHIRQSRARTVVVPAGLHLQLESERKFTQVVKQGATSYTVETHKSNAYFKRPDAADINFNWKGRWKSGMPIVCRHLALEMLNLERGKTSGERERAPGLHRIDDAGQMPQLVPERTEQDYDVLTSQAPCYVVDDPSFSQFCYLVFKEIEAGDGQPRQFLVNTSNHAMAMTLSVKADGKGRHEYVMRYYDPNSTTTHKRAVIGDLLALRAGAAGWTITATVGEPESASYFSSLPHCAVFTEIGAQADPVGRAGRAVSLLEGEQACVSAEVWSLLLSVDDEEGLRALGESASNAAAGNRSLLPKILEGLRAQTAGVMPKPDGTTEEWTLRGAAFAMHGSRNMFNIYAGVLTRLAKDHAPLDADEKRLLIEALSGMASQMRHLYANKRAVVLNDFCKMAKDLATVGALNARDILLLLGGRVTKDYEVKETTNFKLRIYNTLPKTMKRTIRDLLCHPVFQGYDFSPGQRDYREIRTRALRKAG